MNEQASDPKTNDHESNDPKSSRPRASDPRAADGPLRPDIPEFELLRCVGRGGFGEVWLGVNRATGGLRAVKLIPLRRRGSLDPAGRELVSLQHLEAQVATRHAALLAIQHVGKTNEYLYSVMDAADDVSGRAASRDPGYRPATLSNRLETGPLPSEDVLRHARQLLAGLAHLHQAGVVHRDVKPGNCLFVDRELKLADFGLLTPADPLASRLGTAKYMPPSGPMDARADVFAAGLVLYEMMTGLPPESFPSLGTQARALASDPRMRRLNQVVLRACQRSAELRFQDAQEMLDALDEPLPEVVAGRRRLAWVAGLVSAVLLFAIATALWLSPVPFVSVNFITEPWEAEILLDGELLRDASGQPYRTPCTVDRIPARAQRVVFQKTGRPDHDAGLVDFSRVREVEFRWEEK